MDNFKSLALAFLLAALPAGVASGSFAQVSSSDSYMAESAIMGAGSSARRVGSLRDVPSVGVIRLDFRNLPRLRNDSTPDVSEFRILAAKQTRGIRRLRAALAANPVTREVLASRGIAIDRVVGVKISSNGSLRLYLL
jgi:hypothetical protein